MYNRGLTHKEILQNYKIAPAATRDKLTRLYDNDILNADGLVDYEKARQWQNVTDGEMRLEVREGGHFFVDTQKEYVCSLINQKLVGRIK